jgi:hypothetical protein
MSRERETRPYNPCALAAGYAAESIPGRCAASVFNRLCAHAGWTGSTSVGILAIMRETKYAHGPVCEAVAQLKGLGRVTKKQRGHAGKRGGRKTAITEVHFTEAELRKAGATDENYFSRGGPVGLAPVVPPAEPPDKVPEVPDKVPGSQDSKSGLGGIQSPVSPDSKSGFSDSKSAPPDWNLLNLGGSEPLESKPPAAIDAPAALPPHKESRKAEATPLPAVAEAAPPVKGSAPPSDMDALVNKRKDALALLLPHCPLAVLAELALPRNSRRAAALLANTGNLAKAWKTMATREGGAFMRAWSPNSNGHGAAIDDGIEQTDWPEIAEGAAR